MKHDTVIDTLPVHSLVIDRFCIQQPLPCVPTHPLVYPLQIVLEDPGRWDNVNTIIQDSYQGGLKASCGSNWKGTRLTALCEVSSVDYCVLAFTEKWSNSRFFKENFVVPYDDLGHDGLQDWVLPLHQWPC